VAGTALRSFTRATKTAEGRVTLRGLCGLSGSIKRHALLHKPTSMLAAEIALRGDSPFQDHCTKGIHFVVFVVE